MWLLLSKQRYARQVLAVILPDVFNLMPVILCASPLSFVVKWRLLNAAFIFVTMWPFAFVHEWLLLESYPGTKMSPVAGDEVVVHSWPRRPCCFFVSAQFVCDCQCRRDEGKSRFKINMNQKNVCTSIKMLGLELEFYLQQTDPIFQFVLVKKRNVILRDGNIYLLWMICNNRVVRAY